ncbi:hypothetical protein BS78_07G129900, partial [Paspalum vaginatum]
GEQRVPVDLVGRVLAEHEALSLVPRRLAEVQLPDLRRRRRQRRRRRERQRRHLVVGAGPRGLVGGAVAVAGRRRRRARDGRVDGRGPALGPAGAAASALGRGRRGGDGGADGLQLGVDGGVQRRPGGGVVGEVEARGVAAQAVGGLVVGERGLLGGVEGAEPQPGAVAGQPDLRHPLAPVPLPHAAVQLLRPRRRRHRHRHRGLHGLRARAQPGVPLQLGRRVLQPRRRRRHGRRGVFLHEALHRSHHILAGTGVVYSSRHRMIQQESTDSSLFVLGYFFLSIFCGCGTQRKNK